MRALILAAGAALALTACGNNDQTDNTQNVDENLSAENIVSNDVTAIDAVTGDAANMAADVNYQEFDNSVAASDSGNGSAQAAPPRPKRPSSKPASSSSAPAAGNAASSAAGNATE